MTSNADEPAAHALTREEIMPWIAVAQGARLNDYVLERLIPPRQGSFLLPSSDDPLKTMATWCHDFLAAAVSHLLLWADYAAPLKFHPDAVTEHHLRPALTLARAAMESAAQTIWILGPEEPKERGRRYIMIGLWDLDEQAKAAETSDAQAEIRARRDEMFGMLGLTHRKFSPPRYLEMIRFGATFVPDTSTGLPLSPDHAERIWRASAGAAHGKHWLEQEFFVPAMRDGLEYWVPNVEAMSEVLETAGSFVSAGVYLLAMRAGYEDTWADLWQAATEHLSTRITPVNGEPLRVEDVPDFRRTS